MPALLTRMSISTPAASKCSKAAMTAPSSATSKGRVLTLSPSSANDFAAFARFPSSRPFRMTLPPAAARPRAIASPSPSEDPVTSAVLPVKSKSLCPSIVGSRAFCMAVESSRVSILSENLFLASLLDMLRLRSLPIGSRNVIEGRCERLFDGLELDWVGIAGNVIDDPEVVVIRVRPGFRRLAKPKQLAKSYILPAIVLLELAAGDMLVLPRDDHNLSIVFVLRHE